VLTNVLGAREQTDVHLQEQELRRGDRVLLCSDGIHGTLTTEGMVDLLKGADDLAAAEALVRTSIESGSKDNVTAVICRYEDTP